MATRGYFEIKEDGQTIRLYNHWDNYPFGVAHAIYKYMVVEYQHSHEVRSFEENLKSKLTENELKNIKILDDRRPAKILGALLNFGAELQNFSWPQSSNEFNYFFKGNDLKSSISVIAEKWGHDTKNLNTIFSGSVFEFILWAVNEEIKNVNSNKYWSERPDQKAEYLGELSKMITTLKNHKIYESLTKIKLAPCPEVVDENNPVIKANVFNAQETIKAVEKSKQFLSDGQLKRDNENLEKWDNSKSKTTYFEIEKYNNECTKSYEKISDKILKIHFKKGMIFLRVKLGEKVFDRVFCVGDNAEYGSYNLIYTSEITSITEKTVTFGKESKRLKLSEFIRRNYDYDFELIASKNQETSQYI